VGGSTFCSIFLALKRCCSTFWRLLSIFSRSALRSSTRQSWMTFWNLGDGIGGLLAVFFILKLSAVVDFFSLLALFVSILLL